MPNQLNVGTLVSFHDIVVMSGFDDTARTFRVACNGKQVRDLADEIEEKGWIVKNIARTDAMDFASAVEYIKGLGENKNPNVVN